MLGDLCTLAERELETERGGAGADGGERGPEVIDAAARGGDRREAEISLRLQRGAGNAHVYFSDLTPEYIRINAEYTT